MTQNKNETFFVLTLAFIKNEQMINPVFRAETKEEVVAFIKRHSNEACDEWLVNSPFNNYYLHPAEIESKGFAPIVQISLSDWIKSAEDSVREQWESQVISIPTDIELNND